MRRLTRLGFVTMAAVLACLGADVAARQGSGLVLGRVIDGTTGEPIMDVRVSMGRLDFQLTDTNGQFVYFDVTPKDYFIYANKPGYASSYYGQRWVGAAQLIDEVFSRAAAAIPLPIGPGERRQGITIRMWKVASISGRVLDENGEPAVGVLVCAYPRLFAGGRPWLDTAVPFPARTDDRGVYRMSEMFPGDYAVAVPATTYTARPGPLPTTTDTLQVLPPEARQFLDDATYLKRLSGKPRTLPFGDTGWSASVPYAPIPVADPANPGTRGYPTTFAPAATESSSAGVVRLAAGEERSGVDIALTPVKTRMVSGAVVGPSGPVANVGVRLYRTDDPMGGVDVALGVSDTSGKFAFVGVPEGAYRLAALTFPHQPRGGGTQPGYGTGFLFMVHAEAASADPTLWADIPIGVGGGDLAGVVVAMREGARMRGTVRFAQDDAPASQVLPQVNLRIDRVDGRLREAMPEDDVAIDTAGRFQSIGLAPGRYFLRNSPSPQPGPATWTVQSAMWRGRDISVEPVELSADAIDDVVVTFTRKPTTVQGTVAGDPAADAVVVMFPTDEARWTDFGLRPRDVLVASPDAKGAFVFRGAPIGSYFVAAVPSAVMLQWPSAAAMRAISASATRIAVTDTETAPVKLQPIAVRLK